ncbi:MAG: PilT/PilU family type 4a pilus ATPase [Planctomycetota bacterium]|nr:PilT/PilU family type 4a pilus ATPase [Planctomycetota bacterium]
MDTRELFRILVKERGSDLIIKANGCPAMRVQGKIKFVSESRVPDAFAQSMAREVIPEQLQTKFDTHGEVDCSYVIPDVGRFRANVFRQQGRLCLVFRHIQDQIPSMMDLNLPVDQLKQLAALQRGLVLVTGTTGAGKSTTLASMVDYMNHHFARHVITIEDPIEYVFVDRKSMINQREIGFDTHTYSNALRHVVRQTPDVILLGEMRDQETVDAALMAAETGHLVLSTLHTVNAVQTVERILGFFPPHQHDEIRMALSLSLEGVISQRLLPRKNDQSRIPAMEILLATPTIRDLLAEGRTRELHKAIYDGAHYYGTQTFHQSIVNLYREGLISYDEAMAAADNPDELKLELRGVTKGSAADNFDFDY